MTNFSLSDRCFFVSQSIFVIGGIFISITHNMKNVISLKVGILGSNLFIFNTRVTLTTWGAFRNLTQVHLVQSVTIRMRCNSRITKIVAMRKFLHALYSIRKFTSAFENRTHGHLSCVQNCLGTEHCLGDCLTVFPSYHAP
jgi:5-bromo-4-chloroindolyl phosphate hydrolysis protein